MLVALGYTLWAKRKNRLDPHEIKVKHRKEWIFALWMCSICGWSAAILVYVFKSTIFSILKF